jgi:hypothetical protein
MEPPTEVVSNEIDGETGRSDDDDPIPSRFFADSFSQVADRDVDVGSGVAGGRRWPAPALHVGLAHSNSVGVVSFSVPELGATVCHRLEASGAQGTGWHAPGTGGHGRSWCWRAWLGLGRPGEYLVKLKLV